MSHQWASEAAINVKLWRDDYRTQVERLFPGIKVVGEPLGTMEGSGCAMLNVMHSLALDAGLPSLGLLAAGEGSRLWGISASVAFIKGLLNVFGRSLVEQTVLQCEALMRQAPSQGRDLVMMSGTDNVFVPSVPLKLFGTSTSFSECQSRGLFTFSIPITVRDTNGQIIPGVLDRLAQLGIMFSDGKGGAIMFREKPTHAQILADLDQFKANTVLVNAFVFALSKDAASLMRQLYGRPAPSSGKPLYSMKDFDWSGHVLTPIALAHAGQRAPQDKAVFPSEADWELVLDCAVQFYTRFGAIQILDSGERALWYDAGLTADLVHLSKLGLLGEKEAHIPLCQAFNLPPLPVASSSLVVRSTFREGAAVSLGRGCVVSNCTFLEGARCALPDDTILISCVIGGQWPALGSQPGSLCYNLRPDVAGATMHLQEGIAYFSFADSEGTWHRGSFPIHANPKHGNLLEKPIDGIGKSFRQLQKERGVSLSPTILEK